jgi:hypothetical protein
MIDARGERHDAGTQEDHPRHAQRAKIWRTEGSSWRVSWMENGGQTGADSIIFDMTNVFD